MISKADSLTHTQKGSEPDSAHFLKSGFMQDAWVARRRALHRGRVKAKRRKQARTDEHRSNAAALNRAHDTLVVEDSRQLRVRERQRPEAQIGRCVGHRAKDKLNSVDHLVHHDFAEVKLFAVAAVAARRRAGNCGLKLQVRSFD